MIHTLIFILGIILTIFFVVGTHEAAHFGVAKLLGVKVLRFSIGFGKPLKSWYDRSGTEYVIAPIPLGGYVQMLDETEGNVSASDLPQAYNRQPFYKKALIVLAGPACNLFCAFMLYWLIYSIGFTTIKPVIGSVAPHSIAADAGLKPNQVIQQIDNKTTNTWMGIIFRILAHVGSHDQLEMKVANRHDQSSHTVILDLASWTMSDLNPDPLKSLGITPYEPPIPLEIGFIAPESPAAKAGFKVGDRLQALNNRPIQQWEEILEYVATHPDTTATFTVLRAGKKVAVNVEIGNKRSLFFKKQGWLGLAPQFTMPSDLLSKIQYSPLSAIVPAYQQVKDLSYMNLSLFGKMITGKLSLQSLGGPITIFGSAGEALNSGALAFMSFLAFLSIAIGIINLLPIPGLDGGHLLVQFIELLIGRTLPEQVLAILFRIGFAFLFFILIQALANDFLRLY